MVPAREMGVDLCEGPTWPLTFCGVYTDASCPVLELRNRGWGVLLGSMSGAQWSKAKEPARFLKLLHMAMAVFLTSVGIDFKSQKPSLMHLSFLHLKQMFLPPAFALPKRETCARLKGRTSGKREGRLTSPQSLSAVKV